MNENIFPLIAAPAPKKRTAKGAKERQTLAYSFRNRNYDPVECLMRHWRNGRDSLPASAAAFLGIPTVSAFVNAHREELLGIMLELGISTETELLACYGRTGKDRWQWDHKRPLRFADHFSEADTYANGHHRNLRPRIAATNKRRKWETPVWHPELFDGRNRHES